MASSSARQSYDIFTKFLNLPAEIQIKIWRNVVPNPCSTRSTILMIVNPDIDLSHPRVFLPSPRKLLQRQGIRGENHNTNSYERCIRDLESRQQVFNLMHSCRDARNVIRETYRLDIDSIVPGEHAPLWKDPEDMVYFHFPQADRYYRGESYQGGFHPWTMIQCLTRDQLVSRSAFDTLRHIAFYFSDDVLTSLDFFVPQFSDLHDGIGQNFWKLRVPENFPTLESLSLFIDPLNLCNQWTDGKLVLYPPETDVDINLVDMTASEVEIQLGEGFSREDWVKEAPIIDLYVVEREKI